MISIKVNGRTVSPSQLERELDRAMVNHLKRELPKCARHPVTGKKLPLRVTGTTLKNLKIGGV